ncbi:MAG: DUF4012 domain-containing protein [Patescibacteria group bacterium]|nr:DUF4012 domain-containing protein [Patescibacteria group bacterium]
MPQIKKHKIEIFNNEHSSDFVVDLRKGKKEIINASLFSEEKSLKTSEKKFEENNIGNSDHNHFFDNISINNNFVKKEKKAALNHKRIFNRKKFEKTLFYPLWKIIFNFFKKIFYFFYDWSVDIYLFFKKVRLFRKFFKFIFYIFYPFYFIFNRLYKIFSKIRVRRKIRINLPTIKFKRNNKKNIAFNFDQPKQLLLFSSRPKSVFKYLLSFFIFLLFIVLIFKSIDYYNLYKKSNLQNDLMSFSLAGVQSFSSASEAVSLFDFYQAYNKFNEAGDNFESLDRELKKVDELLLFFSFFSEDQKIKAFSQSKNFSKVGIYLSSLGNDLSLSFNSLFLFFSGENSEKNFDDFSGHIKDSLLDLKTANKYLSKIKTEAIPVDYQENFDKTRDQLLLLEDNLEIFTKYLPAIKDFLGIKQDKRYLLVFQNNSEIRASGGFIGSYALIDIKNGKIINIDIPPGGSYDTEGGMRTSVESPKPLHLVKSKWYFWDANWWPDWTLSAKNLMWFLEKSSGPSVDGVISFTPDVLGDLLDIFGSVDLSEKYGVIIDSDNFQDNLQEVVEVIGNPVLYQDQNLKTDILNKIDYGVKNSSTSPEELLILNSELEGSLQESIIQDNLIDITTATTTATTTENLLPQNRPKEIIGDVFTVLLERVMTDIDIDKVLKIFLSLIDNLDRKNILVYFENNKLQEMIEFYSWAGRMKEAKNDYLMIVDSNIAGAKSDKFLQKNYYLESQIREDGRIINKLRIERDRRGEQYELFSGVRNVNWLRVYVPLGSKLISASGFSHPDEEYFKKNEQYLEKNSFLENTENKAEIDLKSGLRIYQESGKTVFANWTMTDINQLSVIEIEYELPGNIFLQKNSYSFLDRFFSNQEYFFKHSLLWQKQAGSENSNFYFSLQNKSYFSPAWISEKIEKEDDVLKRSGILDFDKYFAIILK